MLKNVGLLVHLFVLGASGAHTKATVELAIFCDFEFGEHFQHNDTEIRKYVAIRMYDVNLRFKTLPSVDINFVVTSLTTVKSKDDQEFIESDRDTARKVSIDTVLRSFPNWVNTRQRNRLPNFDIALLALSAETNDNPKSWAYVARSCSYSHGFAVVRFENDNWWSSCGSLESGLGTVLGALKGSDYNSECQNPKYIKGRECSKNHFFFSSCTDSAIYSRIQHAECLYRQDSNVPIILNVTELNVQPPSLKEQCILTTNNPNIWVNVSDENLCFSTICYSGNEINATAEKTLYPLDNSPCDNDKSCFRGRCIPTGFQIRHVESSMCLHSSNLFTSDDNLHLINCPDVPTALDRFMIFEKEDHGIFLATPFTSINASENSDKCMYYNRRFCVVKFQNCYNSTNQTSELYWELIKMENELDEFVIRHKTTQLCLASINNTVYMENCSYENRNTLWNFHETRKPPSNVFWKNQPTPKPTELSRSTTTLTYDTSESNLNNFSSWPSTPNEITNQTIKKAVSQENQDNPVMLTCHGFIWLYTAICTLIILTIILSTIMFKLHKIIKQISMGQLLNRDFYELSRIISTENINTSRND